MHEDERAQYHEILLKLRSRLRDEVQNAASQVADKTASPDELSNVPTHAADRDSEGLDRDVELEANREQILEAIEAALERIGDGTYGRCQDCGTEIPKARLDVLPFALRCVKCEEKQEEK